jgi:hypothetical protein
MPLFTAYKRERSNTIITSTINVKMLYLRLLLLSTLGSLGAFARPSLLNEVCRNSKDWTYNFEKFKLPKNFEPTDGCKLILQRRSPLIPVSLKT